MISNYKEDVFPTMFNKLVKSELNFCMIGSKALAYYGYKRYTEDTDLLFKLSDNLKVIKLFNSAGYKIIKEHWSHFVAIKGEDKYDLLFSIDPFYNEVVDTSLNHIASLSGLASTYILSDKPQSEIDCIELLRIHPKTSFMDQAFKDNPDKVKRIRQEAESKDLKGFHYQVEEPIEFDIEELAQYI